MGRQLLPRSTLTPISWFTCLWLAQGSLRIRREPKPVRKIPRTLLPGEKAKNRGLFSPLRSWPQNGTAIRKLAAGTEGTLEGDVISCPAGDPAAVSPAFEMKAHGACL